MKERQFLKIMFFTALISAGLLLTMVFLPFDSEPFINLGGFVGFISASSFLVFWYSMMRVQIRKKQMEWFIPSLFISFLVFYYYWKEYKK